MIENDLKWSDIVILMLEKKVDRGHSITMLTREGGWVVCEMSTKVNKRWVHGSFMVNVDFQRIASSLFT